MIYNNRLVDPTVHSVGVNADTSVTAAFISNEDGQFFINGHHSSEIVTITLNNNLPVWNLHIQSFVMIWMR